MSTTYFRDDLLESYILIKMLRSSEDRKKKVSSKEFHQFLRDIVNKPESDASQLNKDKDTLNKHLEHESDLFNKENIFNKTRNFPSCPSSANAAKLHAEKILFGEDDQIAGLDEEEKHVEAAKLLLLSQSNTFQHHILAQYGKKLLRMTTSKTEFHTDEGEEDFDELQKKQLLFESFDNTNVLQMLENLPRSWSIVQMGGHDPLVTRFKKTKASTALNCNPALTLVRISGGQVTMIDSDWLTQCNTHL